MKKGFKIVFLLWNIMLVTVTLIAVHSYSGSAREERTYEYWTHPHVSQFINLPVKEGEICQSFQAGYDKLEQFIILFDHYAPEDEATVYVSLEDARGEVYYSWNAGTKYLTGDKFVLVGNMEKELYRGREYFLRIYLDCPYSDITVRAVSEEDMMHSSLKKLMAAGCEKEGTALYLFQSYKMIFAYDYLWWAALVVTGLLYLIVLCSKKELLCKIWDGLKAVILVALSYYNIESLSGNLYVIEIGNAFLNCLMILSFYLLLKAVLLRKAYYLTAILSLITGLANYYVLQFRGSELLWSDVKSIFTAMSVAGNYEFTMPAVVYTSILFTICVVSVQAVADVHCNDMIEKAKPVKRVALAASGAIVLLVMSLHLDATNFNFFTVSKNFQEFGWCYANLYLAKFSLVQKPHHYSDRRVEDIIEDIPEVGKDGEVITPGNIIVIMNESFSDLGMVGQLETNQDYMPFIRNLNENTVKGNLHVSTFGGNTCITEYEFLTGNSQYFLPVGTTPYLNVCEDAEEGLVRTLQAQGYHSVAMHPYGPSNWKRDKVYPAMGFDEFLSLEDYEGAEQIRNYVSDKGNYQKIIDYYEAHDKDEKLFIFNVTMQNHGGYDVNNGVIENTIEIKNMESSVAETYLSLIKESDEAFEYLLSYFSGVEEPTMIVMFGDHLPALPDDFYEGLYGKELDEIGEWEQSLQYITPYIIWTNYASDFEQISDISTNYLGSLILKYAGLEMPKYNEFLLEQRETIPVLGMKGIYDGDGNYIVYEDVPSGLLSDYQMLQYMRIEDRTSEFYHIYNHLVGDDK